MTGHRIRWFARIPVGSEEAPDGWLPRTKAMRGQWGWDVRCSCGWESRTGGAVERWVRELVEFHKWDAEHDWDAEHAREVAS